LQDLILFLLAAIGLTHIIVDAKITEPIRNLATKYLPEKISYMFSCYTCAGVWTSAFLGWVTYGNSLYKIILCAFAGSVLSNFMAIFLNFLEAKTIIDLQNHSEE